MKYVWGVLAIGGGVVVGLAAFRWWRMRQATGTVGMGQGAGQRPGGQQGAGAGGGNVIPAYR